MQCVCVLWTLITGTSGRFSACKYYGPQQCHCCSGHVIPAYLAQKNRWESPHQVTSGPPVVPGNNDHAPFNPSLACSQSSLETSKTWYGCSYDDYSAFEIVIETRKLRQTSQSFQDSRIMSRDQWNSVKKTTTKTTETPAIPV